MLHAAKSNALLYSHAISTRKWTSRTKCAPVDIESSTSQRNNLFITLTRARMIIRSACALHCLERGIRMKIWERNPGWKWHACASHTSDAAPAARRVAMCRARSTSRLESWNSARRAERDQAKAPNPVGHAFHRSTERMAINLSLNNWFWLD